MKKEVVTALATAAIVSGVYAGTASASTYTYKVQKGDCLSVIAHKYHTTVKNLKVVNHLSSDLIRAGQVLKLTNSAKQTSTKQSVRKFTVKTTSTMYTVVSGDTLSEIALRYNVSLSTLKSWNHLKSDMIYSGQKLKVSTRKYAVQSQPTVKKTAKTTSGSTYVVKRGDTLGGIALKYGTTVSGLKKLNGLKSDLIFAGQKLKTPGNIKVQSTFKQSRMSSTTSNKRVSTYVVRSGDTLSGIALEYGTTIGAIKKLNQLPTDLIYAGQKLKVSGQASPDPIDATSSFVEIAQSVMGVPYVWGGSTTSGFDCSGFVYYVANKAGISIGRYSAAGYYDRSYEVDKPVPGDLVFFDNTYKSGISHMGIYAGNNQFFHADETHGITLGTLNNSYYKAHFDSFKRFY